MNSGGTNNTKLRDNLYFNTMIFTIAAGLVAIALLAALLYGGEGVRRYAVFIIVVDIGLVASILVAGYYIFKFERRMRKLAENGLDNTVAVSTCPDYWTLTYTDSDTKACKRSYAIDQPDGSRTTFVVQGKDDTLNVSDYNDKKIGDLCSKVTTLNTPWTDVQAVCEVYNAI